MSRGKFQQPFLVFVRELWGWQFGIFQHPCLVTNIYYHDGFLSRNPVLAFATKVPETGFLRFTKVALINKMVALIVLMIRFFLQSLLDVSGPGNWLSALH